MIVWIVTGVVVCSLIIAIAGRRLRFGFWGYFFASMLLTPVIGFLLLIAAVPTRSQRQALKALRRAGVRR